MPLPRPRLDDRDYDQLVAEALERARATCPAWTDTSPADPGRALVEAFAYLTDVALYRLDRLPDKAFVAFLNILGAELAPPQAATVELVFTRADADESPIDVPAGTRVATTGAEPVVFTTLRPARLGGDAAEATAPAVHARWVEAEPVAVRRAGRGLVADLREAPVIAPLPEEPGLQLAVASPEDGASGLAGRPSRAVAGERFVLLAEVAGPADLGDGPGYVCARANGRIVLDLDGGGAELAERPWRAWYLTGGGRGGNVAAGRLDRLVDAVPGVAVTNPSPAAGGRDGETLAEALDRVPRETFAAHRVVTARDFERLAEGIGGVARAFARNRSELWAHGRPGSVDLLLVAEAERATATLQERVRATIAARMPMGVDLAVGWVRTKPVAVELRVRLFAEADAARTRAAVEERLAALVTPFGDAAPGQALRAADVYRAVLDTPGVRTAEALSFATARAPDEAVRDVVADAHQAQTWFAAAGDRVYRSLNDGASWEAVRAVEGMAAARVVPHPRRAGLVAALWTEGDPHDGRARVEISTDCGETWREGGLGFDSWIFDLAWHAGGDAPTLMIAGRRGLYRWGPFADAAGEGGDGGQLVPTSVDPAVDDDGFYAVATGATARGSPFVAVAARARGGVFLAYADTTLDAFAKLGDTAELDLRTLRVQARGARRFLWACAREPGDGAGRGALFTELGERVADAGPWQELRRRWNGGSCYDVAFAGTTVFGASHRAGVLTADLTAEEPAWQEPPIDTGLPLRGQENLFHPVHALAAAAEAGAAVLAAGPAGLHRRRPDGGRWEVAARRRYGEEVPLPPSWLFTSARHVVETSDEP